MSDHWTFYLCDLNEKSASIFVNLGLWPDVPVRSNPWQLRVRVYLQNPRPDGLSRNEEAPTLFLIEDALNSQVSRECQAISPGRITISGRREFCYYAKTNVNFRMAVNAAISGFPGYRFEVAEAQDPEWEYYLNVLYPDSENLERIKNRDLLDVLEKRGDVPTIPREVQHWIYFPSEDSRTLFRHDVGNMGFTIGASYECESGVQGDHRFALTVLRTQPIQQEVIDETVLDLLRLAKRFGGEYDGWETPVTSQ